ncbi:unnamed protein product [Didymodactylos carnosus]|uniref:Uncharacterized protein n=1 Tax=Didymodactylos carnosus TaxID=1234261 RepID=A0A8S2FEF3_9BILA|nr:unnamed protein product [Didymodactylos carnosus]CAF4238444.1 unnamed protein product [Didymodactylos carnosus]
MDRNRVLLLIVLVLGVVTLLFTIVSIATSGWPGSLYRPHVYNTPAAALGVISVLLILASLVVTGLAIKTTSSIFSLLAIVVLFLASLFTLGTIISVYTGNSSKAYSYNLMTAAHVFLSIAAIIAAMTYGSHQNGTTT